MSILGMDDRHGILRKRVLAARTLDEARQADRRRRPLDVEIAPELALVVPLAIMTFRLDHQPLPDVLQLVALQLLLLACAMAGWTRHLVYSRDIAVLAYLPMSDGAWFDRQALGVAGRATLAGGAVILSVAYGLCLATSPAVAAAGTAVLLAAWAVALVTAALLYASLPFLGRGAALTAWAAATLIPFIAPSQPPTGGLWLLPTCWPGALLLVDAPAAVRVLSPFLLVALAAVAPAAYRLARATFKVESLVLSTTSDPNPGAAVEAFPIAPPPPDVSLLDLAPALRDRRLRRQEMLEPTVRAMLRQAARPERRGFIETLLQRLHPDDAPIRDAFTCGGADLTRRFLVMASVMLGGWSLVALLQSLREAQGMVGLALMVLTWLAVFAPAKVLAGSLPGLNGTHGADLPPLAVLPLDFRATSRVVLRAARLLTLLWAPLVALHFASMAWLVSSRPILWAIPVILVAQLALTPPCLAFVLVMRSSQCATFGRTLATAAVMLGWLTTAVLAFLHQMDAAYAFGDRMLWMALLVATSTLAWDLLGRLHDRADLVLPPQSTS